MSVSSVKNLNGETFSAVQDAYLTDVVSSNSANWNEISAYQANSASYLVDSAFSYDASDNITAYNGSAFKAGDELPSGVMNTSALEYNAVNEISGYNGSAIAQYGAEKQWLVHDDTLVHAANSAQYALGVNLSAVAQLLGIDETVLWSGSITAVNMPITLSEPYTAFNKIKFTFDLDNTKVDVIQPTSKGGVTTTDFGNFYGAAKSNAGGAGAWWHCWSYVKCSADTACTITATKALLWGVGSSANTPSNIYNDWTWTVRNLCEIRGIGRKEV